MSRVLVGKRRFHAFLSHAHVNKAHADQLFEWLRDVAGVPIWYDAVNMPPGATIAQALPEAIENSRSVLLLLSKQSVTRGWVQQEFNAAINHQTQHPNFRIIPIRLDEVSPPGFLQNYSNDFGPSHDVHHCPFGDAEHEQHGCRCVSCVV